jgi:two-component system sensor histidine kinase YesM
VKTEILQLLQGDRSTFDNQHWYIWQGDQTYYLFHLIKTGNVYIGAWVNIEKLIIPLKFIDFGKSGAALLANDKLEPMNHAAMVKQGGIELQFRTEPYYLSGDQTTYLVMREASTKGNFNLIALIPDSVILEKLPYLQRISSVISIGACAFLLLFLFFMRKVFLLPINRIISAMRKLRNGNWESQLQPYPTSTEFEIMNDTFNHMITEIRDLKINVYEDKLNLQKAELKHLQLQINPHFFLNSLNIIYNLATVKDYALIQEMAKCLVAYFRFMFRSSTYFVALQDELLHTKNYLRIQQLRFPGSLSYYVEASDDLLSYEIPPLIIQTMVENSIKHAVNLDKPIEIRIHVEIDEDVHSRYMLIRIEDTGPGFPEDVLRKLQADEELLSEQGEQIGIWNVKRRLRLLYSQQATLDFLNEPDKGAAVRIKLPLQGK